MPSDSTLNVLGISGSLHARSFNSGALRAAKELAPDGMSIDMPIFPGFHPIMVMSKRKEYPGRLSNSAAKSLRRTHCSSSRRNTTAPSLVCSRMRSTGLRGRRSSLSAASRWRSWVLVPAAAARWRCQHQLRQAFVFLNGLILNRPEVMISGAGALFDDDAHLTDQSVRERISTCLETFAGWIHARQTAT